MSDVKDYPPYLDHPKPRQSMTNADRIRSMSDEEMAELLCNMTYCFECPYENVCTHDDGYLNWLQQPAKEKT